MKVIITGSGSYIPTKVRKNETFEGNEFYNPDGSLIETTGQLVVDKFREITGIEERRYLKEDLVTSDMAFFAAEKAIADAGIDKEELDYIIVAHNYGDLQVDSSQSDTVPSLGARVKHKLGIKNPKCVAYDILFGCPGWLEAVIQSNSFIRSGIAKKCLVIGAESLSRVVDKHDRDSMIYSDGAGAVVIESKPDVKEGGILTHGSATYAFEEAHFIYFGSSNKQEVKDNRRYIKMYGRKIYEFALTHVPQAMSECLDRSGHDIKDLKKILIHQANEKMDDAIVKRFYRKYKMDVPKDIMPMSIGELGNSSVATIPTLYDRVINGYYDNHSLKSGDVILFASVGAGMNINAMVYQMP
ncbi:MAG TPA: ketoacyl-ACP synthase III [Flavobacteriaceae bacterium]|nr:ketoacyl-ACP synthase III [Flavobacteriaceae bacterium]